MPGCFSLEREIDSLRQPNMRVKTSAILAAKQAAPGIGTRPIVSHGRDRERRLLTLLLVCGACLFVAAAFLSNGGSALLALVACLACGSRIERNHGRGDYGSTPPESLE
jgi:hypothetical protein